MINLELFNENYKSFDEMNVPQFIQNAFKKLNLNIPTKIQEKTIPLGMRGKSLIAQAKSGTGKTLSFLTILLSRIEVDNLNLQGMVICPTRELAIQIFENLTQLIDYSQVKIQSCLVIGGLPVQDDRNILKKKVQIVVGTIGRIAHMQQQKHINFESLTVVIIDEADKILQNKENKSLIKSCLKCKQQLLAYSATYLPSTLETLRNLVHEPEFLLNFNNLINEENYDSIKKKVKREDLLDNIESTKNIFQYIQKNFQDNDQKSIYEQKFENLIKILKIIQFNQCIIFFNNKQKAQELVNDLREENFNTVYIHGDLCQSDRMKIMNSLKVKRMDIIVASDLVSRGIDIETIDMVINFDIPQTPEIYLHRIGRTGRFGKIGVAFSLINSSEIVKESDKEFYDQIKEFDYSQLQDLNFKLMQQKNLLKCDIKKYYAYGEQSKISEWQDVNEINFQSKNFKYIDEQQNEVINLREKKKEEEKIDINIKIETKQQNHDHFELDFLNCNICYNFLINSEKFLGKKFEILKYFQIQQNANDEILYEKQIQQQQSKNQLKKEQDNITHFDDNQCNQLFTQIKNNESQK